MFLAPKLNWSMNEVMFNFHGLLVMFLFLFLFFFKGFIRFTSHFDRFDVVTSLTCFPWIHLDLESMPYQC